jgi:peptide deformylase
VKVKRSPVETDVKTLHQVSKEVDMRDHHFVSTLRIVLLTTFRDLKGAAQGISAVQCGMPYCAVLLRYTKGKDPKVIYNPNVLFAFGSKKSNEGCLSEGDIRYIVKRPLLVKVSYVDEHNTKTIEWLPYKKARIFMHEYDHLNGVLLQDKGVPVED